MVYRCVAAARVGTGYLLLLSFRDIGEGLQTLGATLIALDFHDLGQIDFS